jgi:hypothetical protein
MRLLRKYFSPWPSMGLVRRKKGKENMTDWTKSGQSCVPGIPCSISFKLNFSDLWGRWDGVSQAKDEKWRLRD